jgi:tRNA pseudouridine38-40 synthase
MPTLKITVAYDGTRFVGWQRQGAGVSIQGLLEDAFTRFSALPVAVAGAGRTDAGVHALAQVASLRLSTPMTCPDLLRAANAVLPEDIRVLAVEEASPGFHARFNARSKRYRYRMLNAPIASPFETRHAWHVTHTLDLHAMHQALDHCRGEHDFAAFQASRSPIRDTVRRVLDAVIVEHAVDAAPSALAPPGALALAGGRLITVEIRGTGFLRHMVRTLVGTLIEIGRGRWSAGDMVRILESRDRREAGPTAPPHGLFLVDVEY